MKIINAPPGIEKLANDLSLRYAEFLGIKPEVFNMDVKVKYDNWFIPECQDQKDSPDNATINFPRWLLASRRIREVFFKHELRHVLYSKVVEEVIRKDPESTMLYLDGAYELNNPERFVDGLKSRRLPVTDELRELSDHLANLDRDSKTLNGSTNKIYQFVKRLNFYESFALEESFAANSRNPSKMAKATTTFTVLGFAGTMPLLMYSLSIESTPHIVASLAYGLCTSAVAGFSLGMLGSTALGKEDFTIATLEQFPQNDRKYLLALPPQREKGFGSHLQELKGYGFPIQYQE